MTNSKYDKLKSRLSNLLSNFYRWDNWPELRNPNDLSWENMIRDFRNDVLIEMEENPNFKSRKDEALKEAWNMARDVIHKDSKISYKDIPKTCPYTFEEAMNIRCGLGI